MIDGCPLVGTTIMEPWVEALVEVFKTDIAPGFATIFIFHYSLNISD